MASDGIGLFIAGNPSSPRQPVRHSDLFEAAATGRLAERGVTGEAYLSHYVFGDGLLSYLRGHRGSVAGYGGPCTCRFLHFDIDRHGDLEAARQDAEKLAKFLQQRYKNAPLTFFSGAKGFHIVLELAFAPPPAADFPEIARRFAKALAELAGVAVDLSIYDGLRIIRLPNSLHNTTGLFKIPLHPEELAGAVDLIRELAKKPRGLPLPKWGGDTGALEMDWQVLTAVHRAGLQGPDRGADTPGEGEIAERAPKYLLDFLRFGVPEGERAVTLFRCAAWLTESGAPAQLVHALLTEPALDTGLTPAETKRQINCGINHARQQQVKKSGYLFPGTADSDVIVL
jgi:hypothetical protein